MRRCDRPGRFLACFAVFGVFIFGWAVPSSAHTAGGTVVGGILPCVGLSTSPLHFVSGTVVALQGSVNEQTVGTDGESTNVMPRTEVAIQTVGDNRQYRFALPPGRYVLHVVRSRLASELPFVSVTSKARQTIHANMPDLCK